MLNIVLFKAVRNLIIGSLKSHYMEIGKDKISVINLLWAKALIMMITLNT